MDWWKVISIEGVACCVTGAICYLIGISCDRDAEDLKSVTRVDKLKDLAQLLNVASKVVPLVVAVSGWVGSDTPIKCKYSNSRGVMVEEMVYHHFLKRNDEGEWKEESTRVHSEWKEVPWYLDDATSRVRILGGSSAKGLPLSYGVEVFEESKQSPDHKKLEEQGLKMLGVKKYERVLPMGVSLTVVGQAFKDHSGAILIRRPAGGPFYVTYDTVDKLIENLETSSVYWKYASISFTVVGVCLLAKHAFEYIRRTRHLQETWKRLLAAAAKQAKKEEEGSNNKAENESNGIKKDRTEAGLCRICYEREYNSVFVPCGHMCCCLACSSPLILCPVCRAKIEQVVRTFHP